jgi:hypothetical protein
VVTFGVFDGVRGGQRAMLAEVRNRARSLSAASVAIVFRPRPNEALGLEPRPYLTDERVPVRELCLGERATIGRGPAGSLASVQEFALAAGFHLRVCRFTALADRASPVVLTEEVTS